MYVSNFIYVRDPNFLFLARRGTVSANSVYVMACQYGLLNFEQYNSLGSFDALF